MKENLKNFAVGFLAILLFTSPVWGGFLVCFIFGISGLIIYFESLAAFAVITAIGIGSLCLGQAIRERNNKI